MFIFLTFFRSLGMWGYTPCDINSGWVPIILGRVGRNGGVGRWEDGGDFY
ncbi:MULTISPECIES: hypothetical protein [unclassified Moorena]|nr:MULTISPECIES: hypothetical protein [unclassified Moorena]